MKNVSGLIEEATEAVTKRSLFTPKRLAIFAAAALLSVGTVLLIKRVRDNAEYAELELEEIEFAERAERDALAEGSVPLRSLEEAKAEFDDLAKNTKKARVRGD